MKNKNSKLTLLLFVVGIIAFSPIPSAAAMPTLAPFNNHYYEAITGALDWNLARTAAENSHYSNMTGHLVTITSDEENNWLWTTFNDPVRYYLGASDRLNEGDWQWVTGEPWSYNNWNIDEPNDGFGNYPEDALSFWDNKKWNDLPDTIDYWGDGHPYVYGYLVEYEGGPHSAPEPASLFLLGSGLVGLFAAKKRMRKI